MLKRIALLLTALTLALTLSLGMLATADGASAAPGEENAAQRCLGLSDELAALGYTQGACVVLFTTGNLTPFAASFCQIQEIRDQIAVSIGQEIANPGQCVTIALASYRGQ